MMRVLVCGGRDFVDVRLLWRTLDEVAAIAHDPVTHVIDGASDDVTGPYIGADYWAHQWARARDCTTIRCSADWKRLGRAAGPLRNQRMVNEHKPDLVVAFFGGKGTADMVRRAKQAGIKVVEVR